MIRYILTIAAWFFTANAIAQEMPKMKPGLWETTTATAGQKGAKGQTSKTTMCINEAVQKEMMTFSQSMGAQCSKNSTRRDGNKYIGEAECTFGGSTMKSQSVATFTSDTAYRVESRATFSPPMGGMSESSTTQEAKYAGACPAGMKPGDMNMGGRTMNISDMAKMMKGAKK
ncbi:MAG: DUF3617 family protein [Burkholderiales bacterium]